jgi:hypothetical protein
MIKDDAKMKKNGNISGLKPQTAKKSVNKVVTKKVPAKVPILSAKDEDIKRAKADKKTLIKVVVVFSLLLLVIAVWFGNRPQKVIDKTPISKGVTEAEQTSAQTEAKAVADTKSEGEGITKESGKSAQIGPIISAVRVIPSQPLSTDQIKVEVVLAGSDIEGASFSYRWKINDQFISAEGTDTLADATLKRGDRISVVVTAMKDGITGPQIESPMVVIHSLPPSLDMKIMTDSFRPGDTVEIQLLGSAPDNDKMVYSLEPPFLEDMALDKNIGRITWKPKRLLPGKLQFGASCSDTDGNKTVKVFALDFGVSNPK